MSRVAFISDIHSNLPALNAVLKHIDTVGADTIVCLGDIVGYGPWPAECVRIIREREIQTVMGNHDEYVTLLMDPHVAALREEIRIAVEWTQEHLSMDDLYWLSNLPMQMEADDFLILHASNSPVRWAYCLDEKTFQHNFQFQTKQLAFCGHSHSPLIGFEQLGKDEPLVDYIRRMEVPTDRKVMVNVGSVGQPRDRNPRACVVFFELETREIWLDRVEYDTEAVKKKVYEVGLPKKFGDRVMVGR